MEVSTSNVSLSLEFEKHSYVEEDGQTAYYGNELIQDLRQFTKLERLAIDIQDIFLVMDEKLPRSLRELCIFWVKSIYVTELRRLAQVSHQRLPDLRSVTLVLQVGDREFKSLCPVLEAAGIRLKIL